MAGEGQDNPSGEKNKYPAVRLKTLPKRPTEPPPPIAPITPLTPSARPEIRIRRLAPKPPVFTESPAPVESPVVEMHDASAVAAETGPVVADPQPEVWEEAPLAPETHCLDSDLEEGPKSVETSLELASRDAAGTSDCARSWPETAAPPEGIEQQDEAPPIDLAATEPVPPPDAPALAISSGPRIRKLARPASLAEPAAPEMAAAHESAPAPAGLPYTPDTVPERIYRRMWWKYDLRVKSNRERPAPPAENQ